MALVNQPSPTVFLLEHLGEDVGGHGTEWGSGGMDRNKGPSTRKRWCSQPWRPTLAPVFYRSQRWGPMTQECPTPVSTLNYPGEN